MKAFYCRVTCDRCGASADVPAQRVTAANVIAGMSGWGQGRDGYHLLDLCPDCMDTYERERALAEVARKTASRRVWTLPPPRLASGQPD